MTSSNRVMNRAILAIVGLLFVAAAAVVAAPPLGVRIDGFGTNALGTRSQLLGTSTVTARTDWLIAAGALIVVVLSLAWILTRGRGRTARVITVDSDEGSVQFDRRYIEDALHARLGSQRDVTGVSVAAFSRRRARICKLTVTMRKGGDVAAVADAVRAAIGRLDVELGVSVPILTQLTATTFARAARAD